MRMLIAVAALLVLVAPLAARAQDDGLITKESQYDVAETLDRLEQAARDNDLTVFARIDHAVVVPIDIAIIADGRDSVNRRRAIVQRVRQRAAAVVGQRRQRQTAILRDVAGAGVVVSYFNWLYAYH